MWTTICMTASARIATAVASLLPSTPVMTSQNGMAVRTTDRPKPIR